MKKTICLLIFLLFFITSCNFPISQQINFNDQVATKAAFAMTATAIVDSLKSPAQTGVSDLTPTLSPTHTAIPDSLFNNLGEPNWRDNFSTPTNWFKSGSSAVYGNAMFKVQNGAFNFETSAMEGMIWYLSYKQIRDFYIEVEFETIRCAGDDQYGLVLRATNYEDGYAYYALFTCDGKFNVLKNTPTGLIALVPEWKMISEFTNFSGGKTLMGVSIRGNIIRLYANRVFLQEFVDSSLPDQGHFGFVINPRQTAAFHVKANNVAYWLLQ